MKLIKIEDYLRSSKHYMCDETTGECWKVGFKPQKEEKIDVAKIFEEMRNNER